MNNARASDDQPSLCVINFNGRNVLPMALAAASAFADRFAEIMVVDNGSQDGSVDAVEHERPGVRVVRPPTNLGAGRTRNAALRKARRDRILFLDNDVLLTTACVDEPGATTDFHP